MFLINFKDKEAIFEQIKAQVKKFIALGVLKPNMQLPSVRSLATDLGINPNTVHRAYNELEREGIIYTIAKKGVYISENDNKDVNIEILSTLKNNIILAKHENIEKQLVLDMIEEVYND